MTPDVFLMALDATPTLPTNVTGVITDIFGTLGTVANTVTGNAVMCIGIAAVIGGIAIKWFKRLTGQRSGRRG